MFRRKQEFTDWESERIRELRAERAILQDRIRQLIGTRIRVSVPTDMGIRPIWDVPLDYAIMQTNMQGGQGRELPACLMEIISQYTPLLIPDEGINDDADDIRPGY